MSQHEIIHPLSVWNSRLKSKMDGVFQKHFGRLYKREDSRGQMADSKKKVRHARVSVDGEILSYTPDEAERVGIYIGSEPLRPDTNYFEMEILDMGLTGSMAIGLVSATHPLNQQPGFIPDSIGFHTSEGRLYKGTPKGLIFGPKCEMGDRIGCGVKFEIPSSQDNQRPCVEVFFTKNRKEIGSTVCPCPASGFFPAVSLQSIGEEVKISLDIKWLPEEDILMCIDSNEDDWSRLHDIRLNGAILEYAGRGKSIIDVGLAQARNPLTTTCHYFEIEIMNPGENCYIAIGLARRDYPKCRHPGWNKGSIAYHADDGKIFVGSGVGDPFGPRCHKGDVMGCGIIFPRDFVCAYDSDSSSQDFSSSLNGDLDDDNSGLLSDSEDEEWWNKGKENIELGANIQVFFTRNGRTIGQKDVCLPKGGFYPTVGMLSSDEKVKVDLHPLSG